MFCSKRVKTKNLSYHFYVRQVEVSNENISRCFFLSYAIYLQSMKTGFLLPFSLNHNNPHLCSITRLNYLIKAKPTE